MNMELYKNIDNKFFIIRNAVPKNLLNYLINLTERGIEEENAILRYNKKAEYTQETSYIRDISKEDYTQFKNQNLFTSGYSKYYQIDLKIEDKELINTHHQNALKLVYNTTPICNFKSNECHLFKYESGNFMGIHADGGAGERLCTSVLYLNTMEDSFDGGEVILYDEYGKGKIEEEIYRYRPEAGDIVIFSSLEDEGIYHSVSHLKNWNRYAYRVYWAFENEIKYVIT
jgi:Rps23 Pro-64 3,4-dihydroxylase Tpa1-like proline 4-hydroxylase